MGKPSDRPPPEVVVQGLHGSVIYARLPDGTSPSREFFNSLSIGERTKFLSIFSSLLNNATLRHNNRQQFRQVEGELFEFKRNDLQMRIFAFRAGKVWYLIRGLSGKKEDALPPGEVKRALRDLASAKQYLGL